jgi:ribosomal protein S18 acetylase RimI-like enzyme
MRAMGQSEKKPIDKKKSKVHIDIREIELEDLPRVYALGEKLFTAERFPSLYRTWDQYELAEFFAAEADNCFVAEDEDGELRGFVLGTVIEKRRTAWTYGWVLWLGVDPDAGRAGVATRLLERITERFCEEGVRILIADTDAQNAPAIGFFEKNGFGNPRSHVYLSKNLSRGGKDKKGLVTPPTPSRGKTRKIKPR